jgi:dethiobiotin synthetase
MARTFLVGTDTAVGKTTVACALLVAARELGVRVLPFKPAQSGDDDPSDSVRLAVAAGRAPQAASDLAPLTWPAALAPGIAEDPAPFLEGRGEPRDCPPLSSVAQALARLERAEAPQLVLIEGAGGLHVPMPGGTWQPRWIVALATHTLVVGRAGLGTIHHTLAAIEGLRAIGRPPLGFVLSAPALPDPSALTNARVIEAKAGVPHLATFPADPPGQRIAAHATLAALRDAGTIDSA